MSADAASALQRGLDHHRAGRIDAAIGEYAAALALDPDNVDALNLRGLAEHQRGDNATALRLLSRAHALQPQFAGALQHLADVQRAVGDLDAAQASFAKLTAVAPGWHGGPYGLGQILERRGDAQGAARAYEAALVAKPDFGPAHFALASIRAAQGDAVAGLSHMQAAVAADPGTAENRNGLAAMRNATGDAAGAEAAYRAALAIAPDHPGALLGLGLLLAGQRRLDEAETLAGRFAASHPGDPEADLLAGEVANAQGRITPALLSIARAFLVWAKADPVPGDAPDALFAPLRAAAERLRAVDGAGHLSAVERLRSAAGRLGTLVASFGEFATAAALLDAASALGAHDAAQNRAALALYDPDLDPAALGAIHRDFAARIRARAGVPAAPAVARPTAGRRIRIGYLSSDFRNHSVARSLRPLFAGRDRGRFEVFGYSLGASADAATASFAASADGWRDVAHRADGDIAATVAQDGIDILVHVAGHFDLNRLGVAVHRPAPVQMSLFDAATSGLPEIGFLFADAVQVPRGGAEYFAERVVRLPNLYLHEPVAGAPTIEARPASGPAAFGSFSNPVKLNTRVLGAWAKLLARVPDATLTLGHHRAFEDAAVRARVLGRLAQGGVAGARIRFRPAAADATAHLAAYAGIDIALDTFPFNGSTSTFEALLMGVPVVTLAGDTLMSRWSAAMLRPLGLSGLVAGDIDSYVATAAALAADRARLATLRASLRARLAASSLCDTARWVRRVERIYRALVLRA
ncbi:MAG: tetratricopeptide repeat protein [Proteobacteria bacterium]|nr:tetratricopeptide repeat protein [Pseudomonadota bacterium]